MVPYWLLIWIVFHVSQSLISYYGVYGETDPRVWVNFAGQELCPTDTVNIGRFITDSSYRSDILHSFTQLQENPTEEIKSNQLIQLLSSDSIPQEYKSRLAFIAAEYKVCTAAPALIKLLGNQVFIYIEPQLGISGPDEALITLGACVHPYLKEYMIKGTSPAVKNTISQIMWHYLGCDQTLVDSLKSFKTNCVTGVNSQHIESIIGQIEKRINK